MQLRSPISCSAITDPAREHGCASGWQTEMLVAEPELFLRESSSESWCENWCENLRGNSREHLGAEFEIMRSNALFGNYHKIPPQYAAVFGGPPLRSKSRKPKSETLGFSQPGTWSEAVPSHNVCTCQQPSKFLCINLWCQGYFRNLFVKVYH